MAHSNAETGADAVSGLRATRSKRCSWRGLKWSLGHAYDNVPATKRKFDALGLHPSELRHSSRTSRRFPFTGQD